MSVMRPPECTRCGERLGPESGSLVTFRRSPSDEQWYRRAENEHFVGHPPNVEWFCGEHQARARELCSRPLPEAMAAWDAPAES